MATPRSPVWSALLAAALGLPACRGEVLPPESEVREPLTGRSLYRLTYNPGEDRAPRWSVDGASIDYTAEGLSHLPSHPGVLVRIPREGGVAEPLLQDVQVENPLGLPVWLVSPVAAPAGERLAFVEIAPLWPPNPCEGAALSCTPARTTVPLPPLRQFLVHVRRFDDTGPLDADSTVDVIVPGVVFEDGSVQRYTVHDHPFQQLFASERAFIFRPTWSPDAASLAFSDGLRLLVWDLATDAVQAIPGTEDGVWPAWSPNGEWIAFTRLERADSTGVQCVYSTPFGPICEQVRTEYTPGPRILTLVRPDGSEQQVIGPGDEPAWSPDGSRLYFRSATEIAWVDLVGGGTGSLPGTAGGREPSVSPDGRHLAFTRVGPGGDHDVWVLELSP